MAMIFTGNHEHRLHFTAKLIQKSDRYVVSQYGFNNQMLIELWH